MPRIKRFGQVRRQRPNAYRRNIGKSIEEKRDSESMHTLRGTSKYPENNQTGFSTSDKNILDQFNPEASLVPKEENKSPQKIKEEDENSFSFEEHDVEYELRKKRSKNESSIYRESSLDDNIETYNSNHLELSQSLLLTFNENDPFNSYDSRPDVSKNSKYLEDIVKCLSNLTKNNTQRDDCFDSFGRYVAVMLRSMSKRRALEVQPEIVKLLVSGNMDSGEGHVNQSDQSDI
ncbi:uncharacterized protein LOC123660508 [Melitaea cinxia]|uniref:uncharacterized protein LOC123660508 n=1 Tax=Melitaea cinxia TaxID=113334 RepID=UPI001E272EE8|nr:uncharacterized protein LOC123660508 [Melitaea cinxia]